MKHLWMRSQLVFVSAILLLTFGMAMALVVRYNSRWDFTREKIHSLSVPTVRILEELAGDALEAVAFYPNGDPSRDALEVFFKECKLKHPSFQYYFYDPDRVPSLAREFGAEEMYTVVIRYGDRQEKVLQPDEESFTNALLRLAQPKQFAVCFMAGHGGPSLSDTDRNGLELLARALKDGNYSVHEMVMERSGVPDACHAVVVAGPHRELPAGELQFLKEVFREGRGVFLLLDPMDRGEGASFVRFLKDFGVDLGEDVIVDKMSRMVGGDFLVPLVSQYEADHPITRQFHEPSLFPVARSVQPSGKESPGLRVTPLALTSSGSWAERDLKALEKGEAAFDAAADLAGPLALAVAVDVPAGAAGAGAGRMVVVGDSDFVTNAYLHSSGNRDLTLNMLQWLVKDDRFISIRPRKIAFQPLYLSEYQRLSLWGVTGAGMPLFFLLAGTYRMLWRKRTG